MKKKRCAWSGTDPLFVAYHDEEWGVPIHDDRVLFEFLVLDGAQAGLSFRTILHKRDAYRARVRPVRPAEGRPLRQSKGRGPAGRCGDRAQQGED